MRLARTFVWTVFVLASLASGEAMGGAPKEIVIGNIADLSGPTSSLGRPYAEGIEAYAAYINSIGGIAGRRIRVVRADYSHQPEKALEAYKRLRDVDGALAIQGWGTCDTAALSESANADTIPYFSACYLAHLTDPARTPYNFFVGADYPTQIRAGLEYLKSTWKGDRSPKLVLFYPDDPFGKAPLAAGREHASALGFELVDEQQVGSHAIEAVVQLLRLKGNEPDFALFGGTIPSCAVTLKDARKLGLKTRFLVNLWGNDESLVERAGEAAEGVFGLQIASVYGDDVPGMAAIRTATSNEPRPTHFIRGWVAMMILCEALKRAQEAGEVSGLAIKRAAETLRNFDTQGLAAPVTYTADDHRPNRAAKIYEFRGGRMVYRATVALDR